MKSFLKSLSIYPAALVGGVLVLALRAVGWFVFLGAALLAVFWFAGELDVSGRTLVIVAIAGLGFLMIADRIVGLAGEVSSRQQSK